MCKNIEKCQPLPVVYVLTFFHSCFNDFTLSLNNFLCNKTSTAVQLVLTVSVEAERLQDCLSHFQRLMLNCCFMKDSNNRTLTLIQACSTRSSTSDTLTSYRSVPVFFFSFHFIRIWWLVSSYKRTALLSMFQSCYFLAKSANVKSASRRRCTCQ